MTIIKPAYYDHFTCLAGMCPDSCCQQWEVDIDEATARSYLTLPGALGDRLRQVIIAEDGAYRMRIEDSRCPMWRQDGLCRIQAELGHSALCETCRDFPRLRHDYGDFVELELELSCPEAARLILTDSTGSMVTQDVPGGKAPEYDTEAIAILRRSRKEFLTFLQNATLPFPQILSAFLLYAHSVQEEIDGGPEAELIPDVRITGVAASADFAPLQAFFASLEILTPQWKARLQTATPIQWTPSHKALLRYFVQRYWLQAVSDYDVICRAKFAVAACLLIGCLGGDLVETAQLFSKEIENDPDNMEAIFDGAYTAPALTDRYLLGLLTE